MSTAEFCLWCLSLGAAFGIALIAIARWLQNDGWFQSLCASPEPDMDQVNHEFQRRPRLSNPNPFNQPRKTP